MKKLKYIILLSICAILLQISCIALDPVCDPIEHTIGKNDSFSISPIKNTYQVGEKIRLKIIIDENAFLYQDQSIPFNIFESTKENKAYFDIDTCGNFNELIDLNTINIIIGDLGKEGYQLVYQENLKAYVLELEITLSNKREYSINNCSLAITLGSRKSNSCHYYIHGSMIEFTAPISFSVE